MPTNHHSPSQLKHEITLQTGVQSDDSGGGGDLTWSAFAANVPARVIHVSGREIQFTNGDRGQVSTIFIIRYRDNLPTDAMRVVFNGIGYNIRSIIDPEEENEWLELSCERGVPT